MFSEFLRGLRRRSGLSQPKVAPEAGIRIATYSNWETGESHPRDRKILKKVAKILGASPSESQQLLDLAFGIKGTRLSLAAPVADVDVPRTEIPKKLLKRYLTAVSLLEKVSLHRSQYIHASIKSITGPGGPKEDVQLAAHLLDLEKTFSVIVSPAGGGKTTLWRCLVNLCAKKNYAEKSLPVPIDLSGVGPSQVENSLLRIAFANLFGQLDSRQALFLEQYLETALRAGTAVALIDEFESIHKLSPENREQIRHWKRIIGFGRSKSGIGETAWGTVYELTSLNEKQQREFIRTWDSDVHNFDSNKLLAQMPMLPQRARIYNIPIFLNLLCEISTQVDTWPESAWALLDRTFTLQLDRLAFPHVLSKGKFRAALTDLALYGYRLAEGGRQIATNFSEAETLTAWKKSNTPERLLKEAIRHGFLQKMRFDGRYSFAHTIQQAFLAAEAWARHLRVLSKQECSNEIQQVSSQPAWSDVCVFTVACLDSQMNIDVVFSILENIALADQSVLDDFKWMLIGKCVVETSRETQVRLEKIAVVIEARKRLLHLFIYAPDGDEAVSQILCRWRTPQSGEELLGLIGSGEFDSTINSRLIRLLGEMQFSPAVPLLKSLALNSDRDRSVRVAACNALGLIRTTESAEVLGFLLSSRSICSQVVDALVVHNTPESARILMVERMALDQLGLWSRAIEDFTNPTILPVFQESLNNSFDISIAIAVQHIGGEESVQILASLLRNKDVKLAHFKRVSELLGKMKLPSGYNVLVEYARDVQKPLRYRYFALRAIPEGCDIPNLDRLIDMAFSLDDVTLFPMPLNDSSWLNSDAFRFQAARVLIGTSNADLILRLEKIIKTDNVDANRRLAGALLVSSGRRDLLPLLRMLAESSESDIRSQFMRYLALQGEEDAIVNVLEDFASALQNDSYEDHFSELMGILKEQRAVPLLKQALYKMSYGDSRVICALGEIATHDAVDVLIQWVRDHSPEYYRLKDIAKALSRCSHSAIVDLLIDLSVHRERADTSLLNYLTYINDASMLETLLASSTHPNEDVRRYIAITLGNFSDERVILSLLRLATDSDEFVREEAEKALIAFQGRIHDGKIVASLVHFTKSEIPLERRAAYIALPNVSAEHKTKALSQLKKRLALEEKDSGLEYLALKAFAKIGAAEAVPYLCGLLSTTERLETRESLFKVLARTNDPRTVPFLIRSIQEDRIPALAYVVSAKDEMTFTYLPMSGSRSAGLETPSLFNSKWINLVNPYYLGELIKFTDIPQVRSVLRRLSEIYNFCVMKDSTVFLATGERVACDDVAGRLI
ncbi:MAG: HEAT repeat domain-containing protein [Chloroflexi bacterium]|nr:HEAT repeat domain-containing protein [Chloroflexota bacterium]